MRQTRIELIPDQDRASALEGIIEMPMNAGEGRRLPEQWHSESFCHDAKGCKYKQQGVGTCPLGFSRLRVRLQAMPGGQHLGVYSVLRTVRAMEQTRIYNTNKYAAAATLATRN